MSSLHAQSPSKPEPCSFLPGATSANGEWQENGEYAGPWGQRPLQEVLLLPFSLLMLSADHLRGIAAVVRAPQTVMTHQTMSRRRALTTSLTGKRPLRRGLGVPIPTHCKDDAMSG